MQRCKKKKLTDQLTAIPVIKKDATKKKKQLF